MDALFSFFSLSDTATWVFLACVTFALAVYLKGRPAILGFLDARTAKIKSDLDEAERLRTEAQELLADCQRKHEEAVTRAEKVIETAKESAARMQKEAETKLSEDIQQREKALLDRITRAEESAVREVRTQAATLAAQAAEILLRESLEKNGGKLVDEAIQTLPRLKAS